MKVKVNVIKFETINGKKVGKAFSFPVDAKKWLSIRQKLP